MRGRHAVLLALAAATLGAAPATAQIMASEAATVSQTVDGTTITLEFARPSLRGRDLHDELLGHQIRWGRAWTPGANSATTLETNNDFELDGHAVGAGRWSVWMVPSPDQWEVVLDPRDELWHTQHPERADDQVRFFVTPGSSPESVASLSWSFPEVRADGAGLRMQWGTLVVDLDVAVEPTVKVTFTAEEAASYVGSWDVEQLPGQYGGAHSFTFDLRLESGHLVGTWEFGSSYSTELAFVEAAEQVFRFGTLMNGEVASVEASSFLEFVLGDDGRAVSFEGRNQDDELTHRGARRR
jgi:hypothetical protein